MILPILGWGCVMEVDLNIVRRHLSGHPFWEPYLKSVSLDEVRVGLHVAIFAEPFLSHVIDGKKTTESRFSKVKCAPFEEVSDGDVIFLKRCAGPVCGVALAKRAFFYDLAYEPIDRIRLMHGHAICASPDFWEEKRDSSYVTLIELDHQTSIDAIPLKKSDRRGWVSLGSRQLGMAF